MNNARFLRCLLFPLLLGTANAEPPAWSGTPDQSLTIKTLPGLMKYDQTKLTVEPGQKVKLTLENADDLEHNWVLLKKDPKDQNGVKFAEQCLELGAKGI